jgi:hypothetical protein
VSSVVHSPATPLPDQLLERPESDTVGPFNEGSCRIPRNLIGYDKTKRENQINDSDFGISLARSGLFCIRSVRPVLSVIFHLRSDVHSDTPQRNAAECLTTVTESSGVLGRRRSLLRAQGNANGDQSKGYPLLPVIQYHAYISSRVWTYDDGGHHFEQNILGVIVDCI